MMCAVAKDSRSELVGAVCSQVSVCVGGGLLAVSTCSATCHTLAHSLHILCTTHAHSFCRESAALNECSYKQFCSLELVLPV